MIRRDLIWELMLRPTVGDRRLRRFSVPARLQTGSCTVSQKPCDYTGPTNRHQPGRLFAGGSRGSRAENLANLCRQRLQCERLLQKIAVDVQNLMS